MLADEVQVFSEAKDGTVRQTRFCPVLGMPIPVGGKLTVKVLQTIANNKQRHKTILVSIAHLYFSKNIPKINFANEFLLILKRQAVQIGRAHV